MWPGGEDVGAAVGTRIGPCSEPGTGWDTMHSQARKDGFAIVGYFLPGLLLNQPNTLLGRATGGKIFPDKAFTNILPRRVRA